MQVAVFACRYILGFGIRQEDCLWLLAWFQFMAKYIGRGEQLNPLDIMLRQHRMLHASYAHSVSALYLLDDWHMLFLGTIGGVLLHEFHRLPATTQHGSWVHYFYHVATYGATIDFSVLSHNHSSTGLNSSLPTPQSGHTQSSGMSSKAVPGAMPLSGSPTAGSYTHPHTSHTYFFIMFFPFFCFVLILSLLNSLFIRE